MVTAEPGEGASEPGRRTPAGLKTLPADLFTHPALFYRGVADYLAGTLPFIREGVLAGEPVAVSVPGPNLELLRDMLGQRANQVLMLDMTKEGRNPGRIIPAVLRAFADRHPGRHVRIVGEPIWSGRSALEYPACAQHEALINLAFAGRNVTILCPYDADRLAPAVLADARATHPTVIDGAGPQDSPTYDPAGVVATYNVPLPRPPSSAVAFPYDERVLPQARRLAVRAARAAGLDANRLVDVELVVGELTANSVMHGGGTGTLTVWADNGHLVCETHDAGHLADPLAGRLPAAPGQYGGRGLLLVNQIADLVRVHTDAAGTTVQAYLAG